MNGKVIKKHSNIFYVSFDDNEYLCSSRKKNKDDNNKILVGDNVEFGIIDNSYVIEKILPRKNKIIRPNVSNVDLVIIVQSTIEPNINIFQLNKYLAFYESQNIDKIILYFSKMDLLNVEQKKEIEKIISFYEKDNYICLKSDSKESIKKINSFFDENNVVCMVGESGVGKSTLINKLNPNLNIKTNNISKALNRGKHTTTTSTLIKYLNGYLVDTPGFGSIEINMSNIELAKCYNDFRKYSKNCKFGDCLHQDESSCEVKKQVENKNIWIERYNSYIKLLKNNKFKKF